MLFGSDIAAVLDPQTPIEETVRAMNDVIAQGKVFYWGTSEWSAADIVQAHAIAEKHGLIAPLVEVCNVAFLAFRDHNNSIPILFQQPQYNLLSRQRFEIEYQPLYAQFGLGLSTSSINHAHSFRNCRSSFIHVALFSGTTIWSPLASGLLTGKYTATEVPAGSRLALEQNAWLLQRFKSADSSLDVLDFDSIFAKVMTSF